MAYTPQPKARALPVENEPSQLGALWLQQNTEELHEKYANQWVAASTSGLVAHAATIGDLVEILKTKEILPENVALRYVFVGAM